MQILIIHNSCSTLKSNKSSTLLICTEEKPSQPQNLASFFKKNIFILRSIGPKKIVRISKKLHFPIPCWYWEMEFFRNTKF